MSESLPDVLVPVIAALAQRAVDEHLTTERQRLQQVAAERTNPAPLLATDKAA